jgi:hypothetical protein
MNARLSTTHLLLVAVLVAAALPLRAQQDREAPANADALAGALAGKYIVLVPEDLRSEVDEVNRRLREARAVRAPQASDADIARARDQRVEAWRKLQGILAKVPQVFEVTVKDGTVDTDVPRPLEMPGYVGAFLFRIVAGDETVSAATVDYSFTGSREMSGPLTIDYAPDGVTWALVGLHDVPKGKTALALGLAKPDAAPLHVPLEVVTPQDAHITLAVLDESGQPTPAMVRLYWKTGDVHYLPSNAIDFIPQFESQGNRTSLRPTHYGAAVPGQYGCTPGPFSMQLAPGEWEVTVRRGVEHEVVNDAFTLAPGQAIDRQYTVRRWVDMPARGWYSGDDHVHGRIMSDDDAQRLMTWAKAEDVHLVNIVKMGDIYRTFFEQRGFGPDFRVVDGPYILSPGQECPRTHGELGHTISMNINEMVRDTDKYYLYDWVFDTVHAQGGLSGYAHVNSDLFFVHRDMSMNIPKQKVDFAEILQFAHLGVDLYYEFLNLGFPITASAGSDVPWGGTMGEARVYAYLADEAFTADAWFDAMGAGRTFVTNGPMLEFRVDDALPGHTIAASENQRLRIVARTWGGAGRSLPSKLEVIRHGEVIREVTSDAPEQEELALAFDLDASHGFWIAARAYARDGAAAHTTPVYVTRGDLRFWNLAAVPEIIERRLANLDEIAAVVNQARDAVAQGGFVDRPKQLLAEQADALMERVEAARTIYRELLATAQAERPRRNEHTAS